MTSQAAFCLVHTLDSGGMRESDFLGIAYDMPHVMFQAGLCQALLPAQQS